MSAFEPCEKCGHMIVRGKPCEICADKKEQLDRIAALEAENAKLHRDLEEAHGHADAGNRVKFAEAEMRRAERERDEARAVIEDSKYDVDFKENEVNALTNERNALRAQVAELAGFIESMPHYMHCSTRLHHNPGKCDCWRAKLASAVPHPPGALKRPQRAHRRGTGQAKAPAHR